MYFRCRKTVLLVVALLLWPSLTVAGCGPVSAGSRATTSTVVSDAPVPAANSSMLTSATTSGIVHARFQAAMDTGLRLGDAVVSHLNRKKDLASLQSLVASSAREGLAQMLSLLGTPTGCKVISTSGSEGSDEVGLRLLFADGRSTCLPLFNLTVVIDSHGTSAPEVTSIASEGSDDGSRLWYLNTDYSYYTAEAVVLGTVLEVLPLRQNSLSASRASDEAGDDEAVMYKGYVLEVERGYGPSSIPKSITVYALGNGTVTVDGTVREVREDLPLDASIGDRLLLPLVKTARFGTSPLEPAEYWVQANHAVFVVDDEERCTRITGAELDPETRSEFMLSDLENAAVEQGREPSAVD